MIEDWLTSVDEVTFDPSVLRSRFSPSTDRAVGRPLVDTVVGSRHNDMKELRPGSSGRSEVRILFAFDPERRAILLMAGDKHGQWQRCYKANIPIADDRYDEHLAEVKLRAEQPGNTLSKTSPANGRRKMDGSE